MVNSPILVILNSKQKLQLETNVLEYTIGRVLLQQQKDSS